jgi:hypothetical protein
MTTATTTTSRTPIVTGVLALALVLVLGIVVLRDGGDAGIGRPVDGVVEVTMRDYHFEPPGYAVPADQPVVLRLINEDTVSHAVSFGRAVTEAEDRPVAFADDLFAGLDPRVTPTNAQVSPGPPYEGFTVLVHGGQTVDVATTLPEDRSGEWQVGCFTGRGCHFNEGLAGTLTVE